MSDVTHSVAQPMARTPAWPASIVRVAVTAFAAMMSIYFVLACFSLYWLTVAGAAIGALVIPRWLIERYALGFLAGSSVLVAFATQTIAGFFPDYSKPHEIAAEASLWLAMGLFARAYFVYTALPSTFDGLKQSITARRLDTWFSDVLHKPLDAIFTRTWVSTSIAILPISVVLFIPSTVNYLVVAAYSALVLLVQFPHELMDHTNHHNRIFTPNPQASPRAKRLLAALNFYSNWVLCLMLTRVPEYHRVQHVYVHHVEENGPADTQSTLPYDRTSFLDFSRHAFWMGLDMTTGHATLRYLRAKKKDRQARHLMKGFAVWYAFVIVLALFNPVAAGLVVLCRFVGGNILSLFAFFQHGLVDPNDVHDVHGNTTNYEGDEHGNLGNDFHVEHHLRPGRHWSQYYEAYSAEARKEGGFKAVVVENTDAFGPLAFVAALWTRNFEKIAAHATLPQAANGSRIDIAQFVIERTRPMEPGPVANGPLVASYAEPPRSGLAARIDTVAGRLMAWALPTAFRV